MAAKWSASHILGNWSREMDKNMMWQSKGNAKHRGNGDGGDGKTRVGGRAEWQDAVRKAGGAAARVARGIVGTVRRWCAGAGSAIERRWKTVTNALNPQAASGMDAKRVFRIRRTVVFSGLAVIIVVVALIVAVVVHTHSGAAADGSTATTSQTDGQSGKASTTKKTSDGKATASTSAKTSTKQTAKQTTSTKSEQEKNSSSDSSSDSATAKNGEQAKLDALAATISDEESGKIAAKANETANKSGKGVAQYKYCIAGKGNVGKLDGFANTVYRVLNDSRGWPRAGATFTKADEGCDFTIVLSEAKYLPSFDAGCSTKYSCRVGNHVIINLDRWNDGIENWKKAGGDLARYRTMVINHEVGHALGHVDNETTCAGAGKPAPLMQEQSMHLDGCTVNEWPLDDELWRG